MKKTLIRSLCDPISVFLFLLDLAFDLKIQLLESIHSLLFGLPQTSPRCLKVGFSMPRAIAAMESSSATRPAFMSTGT